MHQSVLDFARANLTQDMVRNKDVIEAGALDVNGSLRALVVSLGPRSYLGIDAQMGRGVDEVCDVEDLISRYGCNRFDVLICTELLEHVFDWKRAVHNLTQIIKPGGILLVTTRSVGFGYHGYPYDFWRYDITDMETIFRGCSPIILVKDPGPPGVLMLAKRVSARPAGTHNVLLHSMVLERRASPWRARCNWIGLSVLFSLFPFTRKNAFAIQRTIHYSAAPTRLAGLFARRVVGLWRKQRPRD